MRYEDLPGLRWSQLKVMADSPKHYRHYLQHGRPDTAALLKGRMTHTALYEPGKFNQQYVVYPDPVRRGKRWEEFAEYHAGTGVDIVTATERQEAFDIAEAVRADPVAAPLLEGSYVEQVITWTDARTGRKLKGRIDQVNGRLGDLKTTANLRRFETQVENLHYLGQLAWYSDGLKANGIAVSDLPVLIAVESKPPYDVRVLEVSEDDLDAGRVLYERLLARLALCEETGEWPGLSGGEMERLRRPAWAVADDEMKEKLEAWL